VKPITYTLPTGNGYIIVWERRNKINEYVLAYEEKGTLQKPKFVTTSDLERQVMITFYDNCYHEEDNKRAYRFLEDIRKYNQVIKNG